MGTLAQREYTAYQEGYVHFLGALRELLRLLQDTAAKVGVQVEEARGRLGNLEEPGPEVCRPAEEEPPPHHS